MARYRAHMQVWLRSAVEWVGIAVASVVLTVSGVGLAYSLAVHDAPPVTKFTVGTPLGMPRAISVQPANGAVPNAGPKVWY